MPLAVHALVHMENTQKWITVQAHYRKKSFWLKMHQKLSKIVEFQKSPGRECPPTPPPQAVHAPVHIESTQKKDHRTSTLEKEPFCLQMRQN